MSRSFSSEQKAKLTQLVTEGMNVSMEIETLREGLNETIKAVAQEYDIKPALLKKAITIAHKAKLGEVNKDHDELNELLELVGRTL